MDTFIIDNPAIQNKIIRCVEAEMRKLSHVTGQTFVSTNHIITYGFAKTPIGILHRIALKNVIGCI